MKAMARRLQRLEAESGFTVMAEYLKSRQAVEVLRERRRRILEAEGKPFDLPPLEPIPSGPFKMLSYRETLRKCRQERVARQRAERETADNGA